MFPTSFNARVAQRMAIWGAMLGFLACLYGAIELIQAWRLARFSEDAQRVSAALSAHAGAQAALVRVAALPPGASVQDRFARDVEVVVASLAAISGLVPSQEVQSLAAQIKDRLAEFRGAGARASGTENVLALVTQKHAELEQAIAKATEGITAAQVSFLVSHRQNKVLITLLTIFVLGQILVLEYRWLVKPIVRMAAVLRTSEHAPRDLAAYAVRRDEIGVFAQALTGHFRLVRQQQEAARDEQAKLSERLLRQEGLKRESSAFQDRIAEIVQRLEGYAGRMSTASGNLSSIGSGCAGRGLRAIDAARVQPRRSCRRFDPRYRAGAGCGGGRRREHVGGRGRRPQPGRRGARGCQGADRGGSHHRAGDRADRGRRQPDQPAGAQCHHRGARAGEAGRGFGVVAYEVKQLATRTAHATEEVRGGLQGITSASARIAERVAKLVESIEKVDAVAAAIAGAMRRQDANSQAITSNTVKTADDVREVAATVKHVAGMIGEAKQAADLVTRVSTDLGQQAADLRAAVERFVQTTDGVAA